MVELLLIYYWINSAELKSKLALSQAVSALGKTFRI